MADVILIQPRIGEMDFLRTSPSLPLNLLHTVTSVSKKYQIKIIDQRIDNNWKRTLANELTKPTLCIGLTAYTGMMIYYALEISRFIKERSKVPIVWGGIHASLLPKQTLENKYIDIVVQGEGEITFLELAEALEKRRSLKGINGLWFKDNGEVYQNPQRPLLNLNVLPELPYHLVNIERYMPTYRKRSVIPLQTSRGCIYHCSYCYNTVYNRSTWRCLTAENTLTRIKYVVNKLKARSIYIIDDNFFIDLERGKRIAQGIINENFNIEWQVQGVGFAEIEKMDDNYLRLLEKSGCVRFTCGLESGSPRIRRLLYKKDMEIKKIIQLNRRLSKFKIVIYYSFIAGFPSESVNDLKQTINTLFQILKENKMARSSPIYTFVPYPQIPLSKLLAKEGYKFPDKLIDWKNYNWNLGYKDIPYVSDKLKRIVKDDFLYYLSFFLDRKLQEYDTLKIIKILASIYSPLARFRVKHLFFNLMLEDKIIKLFLKLVLKYKR